MRKFIYPYRDGSKSANVIKDSLGIRRIKTEGSRYKYQKGDVIINWGCSQLPDEVNKATVLNPADSVAICTNKLSFFNFITELGVDNIHIPEYTTDIKQATEWFEAGKVVFGRKKLTGHSGEGIVEYSKTDGSTKIDNCPLYVRYIPKKEEYRVHVFQGKTFLVQRKALKQGTKDANFRVRNLANGFIFARNEGKEIPNCVIGQAEILYNALGLDFMAVDIIYNAYKETAYILEVNTAPGLDGSTIDDYVGQFSNYFKKV